MLSLIAHSSKFKHKTSALVFQFVVNDSKWRRNDDFISFPPQDSSLETKKH